MSLKYQENEAPTPWPKMVKVSVSEIMQEKRLSEEQAQKRVAEINERMSRILSDQKRVLSVATEACQHPDDQVLSRALQEQVGEEYLLEQSKFKPTADTDYLIPAALSNAFDRDNEKVVVPSREYLARVLWGLGCGDPGDELYAIIEAHRHPNDKVNAGRPQAWLKPKGGDEKDLVRVDLSLWQNSPAGIDQNTEPSSIITFTKQR